jgi:hypothetical protein
MEQLQTLILKVQTETDPSEKDRLALEMQSALLTL